MNSFINYLREKLICHFERTIYDSSWLLKFSPNVQRPWWIFGHDNIYVHYSIRRTSLFCGSFKEQPRRIIPKRFVWHFISAHVGSWLDELFRKCSSMRWDDCWDHNMIQWAVHTKSNCLYTQFWDYCEISMWPIRLSVRTQDSQSWKSSSILLWATII